LEKVGGLLQAWLCHVQARRKVSISIFLWALLDS